MFFYHYTPAVPFLVMILAYWLDRLWGLKVKKLPVGKMLLAFTVVASSINFVLFYPNWTGIPVPKINFEPIYFALKSWK
jgi:dolichyl-phosphate-mannose--protein O-mannosyl transferase